jgi:SAM-dependent MidA family methyltransferase
MAGERTPLEAEIRRRIELAGPMPVAQYMALCLTHPEHGYYTTRDPFGAAGDFITAPEISQMFGELIGLWAAAAWRAIGSPENVRLVELGPGRGTMMLDALRTARVMPEFRAAIVVHFVEINPALGGACSARR